MLVVLVLYKYSTTSTSTSVLQTTVRYYQPDPLVPVLVVVLGTLVLL
jgi:hypothetical protein